MMQKLNIKIKHIPRAQWQWLDKMTSLFFSFLYCVLKQPRHCGSKLCKNGDIVSAADVANDQEQEEWEVGCGAAACLAMTMGGRGVMESFLVAEPPTALKDKYGVIRNSYDSAAFFALKF